MITRVIIIITTVIIANVAATVNIITITITSTSINKMHGNYYQSGTINKTITEGSGKITITIMTIIVIKWLADNDDNKAIIITNVAGKVPVAPFISEVQSEEVGLCMQVPEINYWYCA